MEEQIYSTIKGKVQEASRCNGACKHGYHDLLKADNIGLFCRVLLKYWGDVLGMHKHSTMELMEEYYPKHKSDLNKFGIYYNDDADNGMVIANNAEVNISGRAKVYAFGTSVVHLSGNATCEAKDSTHVIASDYTHIQLYNESSADVSGRCDVVANDNSKVTSKGPCTIIATGQSEVRARSWYNIKGMNDARVYAPLFKKIEIYGNAQFIKE